MYLIKKALPEPTRDIICGLERTLRSEHGHRNPEDMLLIQQRILHMINGETEQSLAADGVWLRPLYIAVHDAKKELKAWRSRQKFVHSLSVEANPVIFLSLPSPPLV